MSDLTFSLPGPWDAALVGKLGEFSSDVRKAWLEAINGSMHTAGRHGLGILRDDLVRNGLEGLKNTWRSEVFPRAGLAYEPSVIWFSNAEAIVSSFDDGQPIRAKTGGFLAVPIPGSPAEDFPNPRGPDTKVDYAQQRFGDQLKFVPGTPRRPAMLVLEGGSFTKTGKLSRRKRTKTGKFGKGTASIPLFFLVKEVRLGKRLDVQARFKEITADFTTRMPRELARELARRGLSG